MKQIYLITEAKLLTLGWLKMIDRDRKQIDQYDNRPELAFPCALVTINMPRRKNLSKITQMRDVKISIRFAFERLADGSSINPNRAAALAYYDKVEQVDELLQGFLDNHFTSAWECTGTIDEHRGDFDIVRFDYSTTTVK
nr:hypothetical protein [Mucilaginibacter sp. L294]